MEVKLLDHQWKTLNSKSKYTLLLSGIGGGKTWCGVHWCINKCFTHPHSLGFIGANTFPQLRNSTLTAVFNELGRLGIEFSYNQSSGILEFLGKKWLCKSLDNYDMLRGIEIGEFWIDEAGWTKEQAFQVLTGRLRDKRGSLTGLITTSPNGYNWLYDYFAGSKKTNDYALIRASSYKNKHLPEGYLKSLESNYDERLREQELMGEFVNLTQGKAYYAFDREKHVKEFTDNKNYPYWTFCDFNVDPMTGGAAQIVNDIIFVTDERFLRNSDTFKFMNSMEKYWGSNIVSDSTGKARSSVGTSNHDILSQQFNVIYSHNPHVIDRVNNLNRLLSMNKIIIHPRCVKLIEDLEKVSWREGKNELDQTSERLITHLSDGLSYLSYYLYPIRAKATNANITFE